MKSPTLAKQWPQVGTSEERHCENRKFKQKHRQSAGTAVCPRCGAIWMAKHWYVDARKSVQLAAAPLTRSELCPGCYQIENELYEGEVILKAPPIEEHADEIFGLIGHTEAKAFMQNPRSRVALIETNENEMRIVTTTKWLAERIAKEFAKAFKGGSLKFKRSPNEKFVQVTWQQGR